MQNMVCILGSIPLISYQVQHRADKHSPFIPIVMKTHLLKKAFFFFLLVCFSQQAMSQSTPLFNPDSYYMISCASTGTQLQAVIGTYPQDLLFGPVLNVAETPAPTPPTSLFWKIKPIATGSQSYKITSQLAQGKSYLSYDGNNAFMGEKSTGWTQSWNIALYGNNNYTLSINWQNYALTSQPDSFGSPVLRTPLPSGTPKQIWTITEAGMSQIDVCSVSDHSAVVSSELIAGYNSQTFVSQGIICVSATNDTIKFSMGTTAASSFNATVYDLEANTTYTVVSYYVWNNTTLWSPAATFTTKPTITYPSWDYTNTNWTCEGYSECGGPIQSPVALSSSSAIKTDLPVFTTQYNTFPASLYDNGHSLYVTNKDTSVSNSIVFNGSTYNFLQMHFHTPSEHSIDGKILPMEIHLVHQEPISGAYLVLGIIFNHDGDTTGKANTLLQNIYNSWPATDGGGHPTEMYTNFSKTQKQFDATAVNMKLNDLLPSDNKYYTYSGSLTTPPCSQGVTFLIYTTTSKVSSTVVKGYSKKFHNNNARPIQPINNRTMIYSK
jgi:carbonic anhydrase